MPTFKAIGAPSACWSALRPCLLCGLEPGTHHSVCIACWNGLNWFRGEVLRHEISIQVACHYSYPIDRIIQQFKYEQQLQYQILLAGLLRQLKLPKVHAIVPMPISEARLIQRGYNQSMLLAKRIARTLNVPIWQPMIRQQQHSQQGFSRLERLENIEQQFQAQHCAKMYKTVLIIDDVVTTGSSIHALSQALSALGCKNIHAACLAYAD